MKLTPLRFGRKKTDTCGVLKPRYGDSYYITHCGRFSLYKYAGNTWCVSDVEGRGWFGWLASVGLFDAAFDTRRDALRALGETLEADGLMDNPAAPSTS